MGHARDGRGTLFFDGEVGVFPAAEAVVEMDEVFEAEGFEGFEGFGAATASLAVDEVGFRFVEFGSFDFELGVVEEVDVLGAFDVAFGEFVGGADVEDDDVAFGDEFGGFPGFDVFDVVSGSEGGGKGEGEEGEEVFHGETEWTGF
jgi:hypothetical protein